MHLNGPYSEPCRGMFMSIDLDAFYCGVEEHINPKLRGQPFCVVQKHCVTTLSYPARVLGLKKLESVQKTRSRFPNMIMVNGEDLSKYRNAGNEIYMWVQDIIGGLPVERLGLEEMRFDLSTTVTEIASQLPSLAELHAYLQDPEFMDEVAAQGYRILLGASKAEFPDFFFRFEGRTWPPSCESLCSASDVRAYIGGQLAVYIRDRMWLELGYSCSIGVASSKNLSKMVGNCNKPSGVTVLQPGYEAEFMKSCSAGRVPGLGGACRYALGIDSDTPIAKVLARFSGQSFVSCLSAIVGSASAETLWELINGNDIEGHKIKPFVIPSQISIEESYSSACPLSQWPREVDKLCCEVLKQAVVDWYDEESREWKARPLHCRVSLIFAGKGYMRRSKSVPYSWGMYDQSGNVGHGLSRAALGLVRQLAVIHRGQPRVINVCLTTT